MSDKITVKYSPRTSTIGDKTYRYASIVERTTYSVDQLVQFALENGQVLGQFEILKGQFNGFLAAIKSVLERGGAVNCGWFRIETTIKGQIDENNQLTSMNTLKTTLKALQDLKIDMKNFSFQNVNQPANMVKLTDVMSEGKAAGTIVKNVAFNIFGKNLFYSQPIGDNCTVDYEGLSDPLVITPSASDYAHMHFAWPSALDELEDGTELVFTCKLHGGVEGSPEQVRQIRAIYHTA